MASDPYDLLSAGQSNDTCMCASRARSYASGLRWTPRMVADVEVVVVHLLLANVANPALVVVPSLACNIFQ